MARTKTELRRLRENEIISQLDKFGMLNVSQMQKMNIAGFGHCGRRNVLRVLGEMERDGLIVSKHVGKKLYALGGKFGNWEHRELIVDFLVWKGWHKQAVIERPILSNGVEVIRPDAIYRESDGSMLCIEVDRRQGVRENRQKILKYKELGLKFLVVCYRSRGAFWKNHPRIYIEDFK